MAKRKRVGLIFSYNENWIAGTYYILNIIHALKVLEDSLKPTIVLLTDSKKNYVKVKEATEYEYLEYCNLHFKIRYTVFERLINKIALKLLNKKLVNRSKPKYPKLDLLYPKQVNGLSDNLKKVNWIPDFQEEHLPQFFSKDEINNRKQHQKNVVVKGDVVVFSSCNTKNDFLRLYPDAKANTFVLPFAVTHPDFSNLKLKGILDKYSLPTSYFFAPNQFWAHKNHIVILKAVKILKEKGEEVVVAFSGKETDYRNAENFDALKKFTKENKLEENIKFLGFIGREEQLCLLNHAIAIVQPSLFEGWSTVVEDSKALNKFIILSNLEVHKEQIKENVHFFDPNNSNELASLLHHYWEIPIDVKRNNYQVNVVGFANNFVKLIDKVS